MNTTIVKEELLKILEANREAHQAIFLEALDGYRERALEILNEHIARITAGTREAVYVQLPEPEEHTRDYDRIIKMVELHTSDTIELTEKDVACYVMDDWGWKRQFLTANSSYSAAAAQSLREG